jgi:hypothetical protein
MHAIRRRRECKTCFHRWTTYEMSEQNIAQLVNQGDGQSAIAEMIQFIGAMQQALQERMTALQDGRFVRQFRMPRGRARLTPSESLPISTPPLSEKTVTEIQAPPTP